MPASRRISLFAVLLVVLSSFILRPLPAHPAVSVTEHWIDSRTVDLTIGSPSLGPLHPNKVRLLLPPDYSKTATRTWPVLFMMHGGLDDYTSWDRSDKGNARAVIGNTEVITVLPGSGCGGGYMNWWNYGLYGKPAWETYHLNELIPLLKSNYRASDQRAIAGTSMGGFGSLNYATRNPTLFQGIASYSGAAHTLLDPAASKELAKQGAALCLTQLQLRIDWRGASGDPTIPAQRPLWEKYNPYDHVNGLSAGHRVYISSGNGQCGALDTPIICQLLGTDPIEPLFYAESQAFATAAENQGAQVTKHFYAGKHAWPYWRQEFQTSFPILMNAIGATPAP